MQKLIFFDTETTGNTEKDFICQIAYKNSSETFVEVFHPPIKIPPEASAVHHITNKMVEGKPSFKDSGHLEIVKRLFEDADAVVVAHNAPFDLAIIKKEGIVPTKFICTLRVARYLDPEGKMARYNLQYLRYYLEIDVAATAHDALGDVLVLEKLFENFKKKVMDNENLDDVAAIEKMIEISSHPSLLHTFNFGKYRDQRIDSVVKTDRGYLEWLFEQKSNSDSIDEDWIYTLKHYLEK